MKKDNKIKVKPIETKVHTKEWWLSWLIQPVEPKDPDSEAKYRENKWKK